MSASDGLVKSARSEIRRYRDSARFPETPDPQLLKRDGKVPEVPIRMRRPGQPFPGSLFDTDAAS